MGGREKIVCMWIGRVNKRWWEDKGKGKGTVDICKPGKGGTGRKGETLHGKGRED